MNILIGSNNQHKLKEIKEIFALHKIDVNLSLPNQISSQKFEIIESGNTFEENAIIKAKAFFEVFHMPVISDDSGLEVFALGGKPGVYSSRFAGEEATDKMNREKLINELKSLGLNESPAQFKTSICFYDGDLILKAEGICKGIIITEERGNNGFGYDPLFIPDGFIYTFAQLNDEEKNKISHRANALTNFLTIFENYNTNK
jgi:XTP/dITP diphosphohydrolase